MTLKNAAAEKTKCTGSATRGKPQSRPSRRKPTPVSPGLSGGVAPRCPALRFSASCASAAFHLSTRHSLPSCSLLVLLVPFIVLMFSGRRLSRRRVVFDHRVGRSGSQRHLTNTRFQLFSRIFQGLRPTLGNSRCSSAAEDKASSRCDLMTAAKPPSDNGTVEIDQGRRQMQLIQISSRSNPPPTGLRRVPFSRIPPGSARRFKPRVMFRFRAQRIFE